MDVYEQSLGLCNIPISLIDLQKGDIKAQACVIAWLRQQSLNAVLPWPMPGTREQILEERRQLKAEYGALFDSITALLFRHDPIGINFEDNVDEYEL